MINNVTKRSGQSKRPQTTQTFSSNLNQFQPAAKQESTTGKQSFFVKMENDSRPKTAMSRQIMSCKQEGDGGKNAFQRARPLTSLYVGKK